MVRILAIDNGKDEIVKNCKHNWTETGQNVFKDFILCVEYHCEACTARLYVSAGESLI